MHGKKAVRKFKPGWDTVVGPNGVVSKKYTKRMYWQCDIGLSRGVVLRQTKLSFTRTTTADVQTGRDTGGAQGNTNFSSTTVGQENSGTVQTLEGAELRDENCTEDSCEHATGATSDSKNHVFD